MSNREILKKYPKIETELLLAHVLKKPKEFVFLNPDFNLSTYQFIQLSALIKRRQRGEPIAYLLGYKDFYGLRFKVNKNVLVPRPETELVVDLVMKYEAWNIKQAKGKRFMLKASSFKILDVGTGSGNIAVALAKGLECRVKNLEFYASDVSAKALAVAQQNAKVHKANIKFIKSDLLKSIKFEPNIILANLPYGWQAWKNHSSVETRGLKFEPASALFTKENGLYLYRKLLEQVSALNPQPLTLFLEIDPRQKKRLALLVKKILPKAHLIFHKDSVNLWRYAEIAP